MRAFYFRLRPRLLLLVALAAICFETGFSQAGSSGVAFLKLGVSGRAEAMGEAVSAICTGGDALHYNPAGLAVASPSPDPNGISLTYKTWIEGTNLQYLGAYARVADDQAIGLSLTTVGIPDIEVREQPGEAVGTFSARSLQVGGSYARFLTTDFSVGLSLHYLYEKMFVDQASGFAFDVGARYGTPLQGLTVGAMAANLGKMSALRTAASTLPALIRVGPAYMLTFEDAQLTVTGAVDALYNLPEHRGHALLGAELEYDRVIAIRAGYQSGAASRAFSAGVGIAYGIFDVQYAYVPLRNSLGTTSTFTIGVRF